MAKPDKRVVVKIKIDTSEADESIERLTKKLDKLKKKAREFQADFALVTQSLSEFAYAPETKETVADFASEVREGLMGKRSDQEDDRRVVVDVIKVELDTSQVDQDLGELERKLERFRAKVREAKNEVAELKMEA